MIYTTNAVESRNAGLRKVLKQRRTFPGDAALLKTPCLALHGVAAHWKRPVQDWNQALNQFSMRFGDRLRV